MADFENNDVISLSARLEYSGGFSVVNVWYVQLDSGGPTSLAGISAAIQAYMDTLYGYLTAYFPDEVTPVSIGVRNETQSTVFGAIAWGSWAGGTATQQVTALGVALLAFARTYVPRVQIRKYMGPFTENDIYEGEWAATIRGAAENMMADHISQNNPQGTIFWTGVAYNRTLGTVTHGQTATTSEEPAYQRRRKRGRGS